MKWIFRSEGKTVPDIHVMTNSKNWWKSVSPDKDVQKWGANLMMSEKAYIRRQMILSGER